MEPLHRLQNRFIRHLISYIHCHTEQLIDGLALTCLSCDIQLLPDRVDYMCKQHLSINVANSELACEFTDPDIQLYGIT